MIICESKAGTLNSNLKNWTERPHSAGLELLSIFLLEGRNVDYTKRKKGRITYGRY